MNSGSKLVAIAYFMGGVIVTYLLMSPGAPTRQELQDEFDSYQICMQSAHVCRMVHEDYVRYHELKRMLNSPTPE